MVKRGLEKIFLKFLHAGDYFSLLHNSVQNHKFCGLLRISELYKCKRHFSKFHKTSLKRSKFHSLGQTLCHMQLNTMFGPIMNCLYRFIHYI